MYLKQLYIEGFRNFKKATINFDRHCLLIGANDVGKTNMIYALRILLDRGFSDYDLELKESDFFAYVETNKIIIRAYLSDVVEDCVVAQMKGKISDDNKLVLQYEATIDNGKVSYNFYCGKSDSEEDLAKIDAPYYKKFLNVKYISSKRDFVGYINKTKKDLLLQSKSSRPSDVIERDDALYNEIEGIFKDIDEKIPQLSYVKNATKHLNEELNKLSIHNNEQRIVFDTASVDIDKVIANVSLTSKFGEKKLFIGGEGRINQIYLSLWALQNQPTVLSKEVEVSIICVEEPEAYLHPHQQRELALYLGKKLSGQVILTSHSPYIVSEFSPNSIIRLFKNTANVTCVASNGCSNIIGDAFEDFGYRMSVIPAEAFFSDCVILVEGPSEMIFYKTLAKQIGIELDRLNISILSVDGVGFKTYIDILNSLEINWIVRTDNDIMKLPKKQTYRFAGIERGLSFLKLRKCCISPDDTTIINENKTKLRGFNDKYNIPDENKQAAECIIAVLHKYNIYLAKEGLEEDLCKSTIHSNLVSYYSKSPSDGTIGEDDDSIEEDSIINDETIVEDDDSIVDDTIINDDTIIEMMKEKKAVNMYEFLKVNKECLTALKDDALSFPLISAKQYVENTYGTY